MTHDPPAGMHEHDRTEHRVPFDGSFRIGEAPTAPPDDAPSEKHMKKARKKLVKEIDDLQRRLYAQDTHAVLLVFQALDAAGKDSTIRAVLRGVNPAGCRVASFKQPSANELDHDFLWRTTLELPGRGTIGVFNRSYYEEVLVVRVHPEYLGAQKLPDVPPLPQLWSERYASIRDHEAHLTRNGLVIIKFWLNVSRDEQRHRFLRRLNRPDKNWKFSTGDVEERGHWPAYMEAYADALNATSRPWAPWYAIPADSKPYMRLAVARIIVATLERLDPQYPTIGDEKLREFETMRDRLDEDG